MRCSRRSLQVPRRHSIFVGVEGASERAFARFLEKCCNRQYLPLHLNIPHRGVVEIPSPLPKTLSAICQDVLQKTIITGDWCYLMKIASNRRGIVGVMPWLSHTRLCSPAVICNTWRPCLSLRPFFLRHHAVSVIWRVQVCLLAWGVRDES